MMRHVHLALLFLVVALAWPLRVQAADPTAPAAETDDVRLLDERTAAAVAAGDLAQARALASRRLSLLEVASYLSWRPGITEALTLEALGDAAGAAALYRKGFEDDLVRTVEVLRIVSRHPDREALAAEGKALAFAAAERVRAGESVVLYVTSKGEARPLVPMTTEKVLELSRKGEMAQYCFVEDLDFTGVTSVPETVQLDRCLIGRIRAPGVAFDRLVIGKSIVLGDADLGKTFQGEVNKSKTDPPSSFRDLYFRETLVYGRANFWDVTVRGGRAYFPLAVFEGAADYRGAELVGVADFRFASFGADANFKHMRVYETAFFGGSRYRADTVFTGFDSVRNVYFNSATFEGKVTFEGCEWSHDATFEDTTFEDAAMMSNLRITGALNLSRARFLNEAVISRLRATDLDALGVRFEGAARFTDATILRRTRFSLDAVTREAAGDAGSQVLPLYRWYQGDEDADEPLVTGSSYGVQSLDDLTAHVAKDLSFANTVFGGYTVFEGLTFGTEGERSIASFYNAQLQGETHFEGTRWHSLADFSTIFGYEVAFNDAVFERSLILDDANVRGRVSLSGVTFAGDATVSFDVAEISTLEIDPEQLADGTGHHRLFYERCALGDVDPTDPRIHRLAADGVTEPGAVTAACYEATAGEFTTLRGAWEDANMTEAADDAYWWLRHHEARAQLLESGLIDRLSTMFFSILVYEGMFGWGVRLGNLSFTALGLILAWAMAYRHLCRTVHIQWFGESTSLGELTFSRIIFFSLCCFLLADYGVDLETDDHRLRALIAAENVTGVLVITFFVGAYTRLILS